MSRRLLAVGAALALAAVATLALVSYIRGLEREALAAVETIEVLVAAEAIAAGTTAAALGDQGLVERESAPRRLVPAGAVASLDDIAGEVAAVDILPGEVISAGRFLPPTEARALLPIPDDMQAMSFEVSVPPGVAGFVQNGDTVSIIAQLSAPPDDDEEETALPGAGADPRAQFLLQNVAVLNVGQRVVATEEEGEGESDTIRRHEDRVLLTVAVTAQDAEKLAFAALNGELWLTLVPEDAEPVTTPGRTFDNAFDD